MDTLPTGQLFVAGGSCTAWIAFIWGAWLGMAAFRFPYPATGAFHKDPPSSIPFKIDAREPRRSA
jgi:hypothetical protein